MNILSIFRSPEDQANLLRRRQIEQEMEQQEEERNYLRGVRSARSRLIGGFDPMNTGGDDNNPIYWNPQKFNAPQGPTQTGQPMVSDEERDLAAQAFPERAAEDIQKRVYGEDPKYTVVGDELVQTNGPRGPRSVYSGAPKANTSEEYNDYLAAAAAKLGPNATPEEIGEYAANQYLTANAPRPEKPTRQYRPMTPEELAAHNLQEGTVAYMGPDGKPEIISRPPSKSVMMYAEDGRPAGVFDQNDPNVAAQLQDGTLFLKPPKAIPTTEIKELEALAKGVNQAESLLNGFQDSYAGNVMGRAENAYKRFVGDDTGQVQWWQSLDAADAITRNELFGASLTPGEQAAWERTTVTPGMDPAEVRKRLSARLEIIRSSIKRRRDFYKAGGYNMGQIDSFFAPSIPTPADDAKKWAGWSAEVVNN